MTEYDLYILCAAKCKVHNPVGFVETELFNTFEAAARSKISLASGVYYELEMDLPSRSKISVDAYNWTEWLKSNSDRAIPRYACSIVDAGTGALLITLPLRSFQGRMRVGTPDYISAVISGNEYFDLVTTYQAAGAEMVISKALYVDGDLSLTEEIARVVLEKPRKDAGASSHSMTLYGYRESAKGPKTVQMATYPKVIRVINGGIQMVFPEPDLFLRAGDTVVVTGHAPFDISSISYTVSADGPSVMTVIQETA